jgi:hypothetical protein
MIISSLLSGGLTGLLGSIVSNVTDLWKDHADKKQELALKRLDIEMMDKEWSYKARAVDRETEARMVESADELRAASYKADAAAYAVGFSITNKWHKGALVLVDVIRGLVRPCLTMYMIWLVWETREEANALVRAAGVDVLPVSEALSIYQSIVAMILYLAATVVAWWFGTRPKASKARSEKS